MHVERIVASLPQRGKVDSERQGLVNIRFKTSRDSKGLTGRTTTSGDLFQLVGAESPVRPQVNQQLRAFVA
jgi:hypothetical protein